MVVPDADGGDGDGGGRRRRKPHKAKQSHYASPNSSGGPFFLVDWPVRSCTVQGLVLGPQCAKLCQARVPSVA
ncbi:hypothetical protein M0804_006498 [Polistes exclamans]|nr:hypothetical protein M0804_006498 [Polistes exclamans]